MDTLLPRVTSWRKDRHFTNQTGKSRFGCFDAWRERLVPRSSISSVVRTRPGAEACMWGPEIFEPAQATSLTSPGDMQGYSRRSNVFLATQSSFHHYFSIPLTWMRYSHASLCDAKIDTSRIKLANRDLAILTPDETGWFRALRLRKAPRRGNTQTRAKTGQKSGKWGVGSGEKILLPIPHSSLPIPHLERGVW